MTFESTTMRPSSWTAALTLALTLMLGSSVSAGAQSDSARDPRIGLRAGATDAGVAARNVRLIAHRERPDKFFNPSNISDFGFANTDLAFSGSTMIVGGYNGFQIWDVADPKAPTLKASHVCPGGQGDPSIHKNLLFISVEERKGRSDCGAQGVTDSLYKERFVGVRIFDISDPQNLKQVGAVQTCRGSHTHTLVSDPKDSTHIYVYVSGTSGVRPETELAGCSGGRPEENPNTAYFRIEVIHVPLAAPQNARIVNSPRIFADSATGAIAGLWKGGQHGEGTQRTSETNQCHDLTAYSAIGLAAGACSGNGILLDIRDPANPKRIAEVMDPNFAYWHSATFNNDGTKVLFTDEWGGGSAPRCQSTDKPTWGADAIFTLANRKLTHVGYYKLPAAQSAQENCVAHNGTMVPVPGRDIMVQAWYQGGMSVFDFTDAKKPVEIAYFDRGPMDSTQLQLGGYWSTYWYNGHIYGSEILRGIDVFELVPSEHLSQNEIDAAKSVRQSELNVQNQSRIVWPANFSVARAYVDQLQRSKGLPAERLSRIARELDRVEKLQSARRRAPLQVLATQLKRDARASADAAKVTALAGTVERIGR
jgi:hypothetical protein